MKIARLLCLYSLLFSFKIYSQSNNDYKGLNVEYSVNILDEHQNRLWTLRPNITYNHNKFQFLLGPVISNILVSSNNNYGTSSINIITGFSAGTKFYTNQFKKNRFYLSIENIYLNYHSNERLEAYSNNSIVAIVPCNQRNNVIIIQPLISSGQEFIWFKTVSFTVDFGLGWSFRKYKYPDHYHSYYPTKISNLIGQLKFSLGLIF